MMTETVQIETTERKCLTLQQNDYIKNLLQLRSDMRVFKISLRIFQFVLLLTLIIFPILFSSQSNKISSLENSQSFKQEPNNFNQDYYSYIIELQKKLHYLEQDFQTYKYKFQDQDSLIDDLSEEYSNLQKKIEGNSNRLDVIDTKTIEYKLLDLSQQAANIEHKVELLSSTASVVFMQELKINLIDMDTRITNQEKSIQEHQTDIEEIQAQIEINSKKILQNSNKINEVKQKKEGVAPAGLVKVVDFAIQPVSKYDKGMNYHEALQTCVSENLRLCSVNELQTALKKNAIPKIPVSEGNAWYISGELSATNAHGSSFFLIVQGNTDDPSWPLEHVHIEYTTSKFSYRVLVCCHDLLY